MHFDMQDMILERVDLFFARYDIWKWSHIFQTDRPLWDVAVNLKLWFWNSLQCKPDISRSCISRNWIYRGRMLDPVFWRPRARYFLRNRGNTLDPIRGRQFSAKSAHRDSLCSRFAGDNFSRNQLWPTCQCGLEHMLCDGQPSSAEHWHLHCIAE